MGRALPRGSTKRLTLTGDGGRLDRVQHAMAYDSVLKGGTETCSLAIIASETRIRLGDVGGRARALRRCPTIPLWHGQDLERGPRSFGASYVHLEDLDLPAGGGELQVAVGPLISHSRFVPRERPPR